MCAKCSWRWTRRFSKNASTSSRRMKQSQKDLTRSERIHGSVLKLLAPYYIIIAIWKVVMFHLTECSVYRLRVEFHLRDNWLRWGIRNYVPVLVLELGLVHEWQDWFRSRGILVSKSFLLILSQCIGILWYRTLIWKGCALSSLSKWLWTVTEWPIANLQFCCNIVHVQEAQVWWIGFFF